MPDTDPTTNHRGPGAPKGRPTPGRRQRNEAARARARRERMILRAWLIGSALVVIGVIVVLVVTGAGAGPGGGHLGG